MKKIRSFLIFVLCTTVLFAQKKESSEKNKIKVFILSGQSNIVDWGYSTELPDSLRYGTDNKLIFEDGNGRYLNRSSQLAFVNKK